MSLAVPPFAPVDTMPALALATLARLASSELRWASLDRGLELGVSTVLAPEANLAAPIPETFASRRVQYASRLSAIVLDELVDRASSAPA